MIKASEIKTGMKFWDGSNITVKYSTTCFITVSLSNGEGMEGKSVEVKWKKSSMVKAS